MDIRGRGFIKGQAGVLVGQLEQWQSRSASLRLILRGKTCAAVAIGEFRSSVIEVALVIPLA